METTKTKPLTKKQIAERERAEAIAHLRRLVPIGSTVYGIVRKVSASGMSRSIDFYVVDEDRSLAYLSGYMATAVGWARDKRGSLKVAGCGMDMIFHAIYETAGRVWANTPEYEAWEAAQKSGRPTSGGYVWRSEQL